MSRWFAISTRSRHEKVVHRELSTRNIETFLPTMKRWSRWKDRRKQVEWPLFPGYCFARFDVSSMLPVMKCIGVVSVVSFDGEPAPIPDHEIDGIRRLVAIDWRWDPCPLVKEGELVEVVSGPLTGIVGRLLRKGPSPRLILSVEVTNSAVSVQVDAADVKPC